MTPLTLLLCEICLESLYFLSLAECARLFFSIRNAHDSSQRGTACRPSSDPCWNTPDANPVRRRSDGGRLSLFPGRSPRERCTGLNREPLGARRRSSLNEYVRVHASRNSCQLDSPGETRPIACFDRRVVRQCFWSELRPRQWFSRITRHETRNTA